jgi:hypothetical protein
MRDEGLPRFNYIFSRHSYNLPLRPYIRLYMVGGFVISGHSSLRARRRPMSTSELSSATASANHIIPQRVKRTRVRTFLNVRYFTHKRTSRGALYMSAKGQKQTSKELIRPYAATLRIITLKSSCVRKCTMWRTKTSRQWPRSGCC